MSSVPASPPSLSTVPKTTESNSRFHLSIYKQGGGQHGCRPVYLSAMSGHKHQFANNHSLMHHHSSPYSKFRSHPPLQRIIVQPVEIFHNLLWLSSKWGVNPLMVRLMSVLERIYNGATPMLPLSYYGICRLHRLASISLRYNVN